MISLQQLDKLAGAVVLDRTLGKTFLSNRLGAIEAYNRNYATRYGEEPILLSEEDKDAIMSVSATSLPEFFTQALGMLKSTRPLVSTGRAARYESRVYEGFLDSVA